MPIYEYECAGHGMFEVIRSLAEHAEPALCPDCDQVAARVLSSPYFSSLSRADVVARDRNERSSHEPRVSSRPDTPSGPRARSRGARHSGCGHDHSAPAQKSVSGSQQLKRYTGVRPWVMEHG